jgi:DNA-binding MarR family transcriptional regulator
MAQGDIAPGSHRIQPGADPQAKILDVMAADLMGYWFSTREAAGMCNLTTDCCRRSLKILVNAGLVERRDAPDRKGFSKILWRLTPKGRTATGG